MGRTSTQEQLIKKDIKTYLTGIGAFWSIVQGGSYSKPGDPDIVACVKGRYVGIEAKTPTGKLSELQKVRGAEIEKAGGIWMVVTSKEAVDRELKERGLV